MSGQKITIENEKLNVPDNPIIPFIEGDGIGPDIWASAVRVLDAAVEKAYGGKRKIEWKEVYAGQKAVGGGIRSLNVALRQKLDLFACVRPVRYFDGVPSPVVHPEYVDMVIFRENTEDIYAGIEYLNGTAENEK